MLLQDETGVCLRQEPLKSSDFCDLSPAVTDVVIDWTPRQCAVTVQMELGIDVGGWGVFEGQRDLLWEDCVLSV